MTQRHIIHEGERNAMLRDGLSNAELKQLLSAVDARGNLQVSNERIDALIAGHALRQQLDFQVKTEEKFDTAQALVDLKQAKKERAENVADNAVAISSHVRFFDRLARGEGLNAIFDLQRAIAPAKATIQDGKSRNDAPLSQAVAKAVTCQYLNEVLQQPVGDGCTPPSLPSSWKPHSYHPREI